MRIRVNFVLILALVITGLSFTCQSAPQESGADDSELRNVILIVTDDVGYADFFQNEAGVMSNLAGLKSAGAYFPNAYAGACVCSPSRFALYTGIYPARHGWFVNPHCSEGMPLEIETVAERLKRSDISTSFIGKWHLGEKPTHSPRAQGFDYFFGFLHGSHDYWQSTESGTGPASKMWENDNRISTNEHLSELFFEKAAGQVSQWDKSKRHFLAIATNAAHGPLQPTAKAMERVPSSVESARAHYLGHIVDIDRGVGALLNALDERDLMAHTVMFLTNDNGGDILAEHMRATNETDGSSYILSGELARNDPFSGNKGELREGGIRVPLVVACHGMASSFVAAKPVSFIDVTPTILDLFSIQYNRGEFDGESFADCLNRDVPPQNRQSPLFFLLPSRKSVEAKEFRDGSAAIIDWPWKLLITEVWDDRALYQLNLDPAENHNVRDIHPEVMNRLDSLLNQFLETKVSWTLTASKLYRKKHGKQSHGADDE